jgi:RHS repeat-associated protein
MTVQYVGGQDQIISSTDSLGLTSTFSYDPLGRLLVATDPGGNTETRAYNTRGEVTLLNNAYQNTSSAPGSYAISRAYDVAGRLIQETNAVGEVIAYTVDAKGRLLRRSGSDSKGSTFAYDANGFENLTAVISTLPGAGASVESRFDYEYDIKGRKSTSTLSLANGDKFTTAYKYDWQDQVVQQDLTDGTAITRSYDSGLLASVSMAGPKGEDWSVTGAYTQYSAFNTPGQLTVDGSDIMTASLTYSFDYDSLGFPSSRGINNSTQTLAKYLYTYNEQDLLVKRSEDVSGDEIAYEYAGRRLQSSYTSSGTQSTYTHDASGNLEVKAGITFSKKLESLIGTQNGSQVIEVQYDGAGRMSTRSTSEANLTFVYDSLGNMSAIQNATTGHRSQFSQDHIGRTLVRNLPDGSTEVLAGGGLTVKISPNGQRLMQRKLVGNQSTICIVSTLYNAASNSAVTSPNTGSIAVYFADTKDNVTHVFQGDGNLTEQLKYDDFGLCTSTSQDQPLQTYEGRRKDVLSGLLDFGSRWYDPVIGRFAIPDNILSTKPFLMQDGMNRYVFENNDPINHVSLSPHLCVKRMLTFRPSLSRLIQLATGYEP